MCTCACSGKLRPKAYTEVQRDSNNEELSFSSRNRSEEEQSENLMSA